MHTTEPVRTYYLCGGAKNGKSALAQQLALQLHRQWGGRLYYLATMIPQDGEDEARVRRHRQERAGLGFITLERGRELAPLAQADGVYLLDSVTALLANVMFPPDGPPETAAADRVAADLLAFVSRARAAVLVTDSLGQDGRAYEQWTRQYQLGLAQLDRQLAQACDTVAELVAGLPIIYKGSLPI